MPADLSIQIRLDRRYLATGLLLLDKLGIPHPHNKGGALRVLLEHTINQYVLQHDIEFVSDTEQATMILERSIDIDAIRRSTSVLPMIRNAEHPLGASAEASIQHRTSDPLALRAMRALQRLEAEEISQIDFDREIASIQQERDLASAAPSAHSPEQLAERSRIDSEQIAEMHRALGTAPTAPIVTNDTIET